MITILMGLWLASENGLNVTTAMWVVAWSLLVAKISVIIFRLGGE